MRALLTGKDCPHVREKGSGKQNKVSTAGQGLLPARPRLPCPLLSVPAPLLPQDLYELAFSISYDRGEEEAYLNFIAPSKQEVSVRQAEVGRWAGEADGQTLTALCHPQFYLWTDGLSALLGSPMGSEQTRLDLEQLLTMETKLRLLELENVPIPERPPPVPPPPTNFNFCYDCSIAEP